MFGLNKYKILEGKVAIITGAGRGIGKETALLFAKYGCNIVICSRTKKELEDVKNEIEKINLNIDVLLVEADVSRLDDVKNVIKETINKFGKINILINNAGIGGKLSQLVDISYTEIDSLLDINLKGLIYFTKETLPYILKEDFGRIINISSWSGKYGMANFSVYCATKFGVIGFTESVSKELKGNIKTYSICPKATDTKLYNDIYPNNIIKLDSPKLVAEVILNVTLKNKKNGSSIFV